MPTEPHLSCGGKGPLPPWRDSLWFKAMIQVLTDGPRHSLVNPSRLWILAEACSLVRGLVGCAVEFGVYRGGSAWFLRNVLPSDVVLHLYDSFQGLPKPSPHDGFHEGDFGDTSLDQINDLAQKPNVVIHTGVWSADVEVPESVCFAHLDCDIYPSAKDALAALWPKMLPGGLIVCDDYGFPNCQGVYKAVNEFIASYGVRPMRLETGQCLLFR